MKNSIRIGFVFVLFVVIGVLIFRYFSEQKEKKLPFAKSLIKCDSELLRLVINTFDYDRQLRWLRDNNQFVCNDSYYECVLSFHKVESIDRFESYALNSPTNQTDEGILYYKISASRLNQIINSSSITNCYQSHVDFDLTNDPVSGFRIAHPNFVDFDSNLSCYSIPLLRGIINELIKNHNDLDATYFEFCHAEINHRAKKIFKVENSGIATPYFDISDDPKFLPKDGEQSEKKSIIF